MKSRQNGASFRLRRYPSIKWRVAELLYQGLTYKVIAQRLVVSYHTVKKHVENIYTKCGVQSRYQLYKWIEGREQKTKQP